MSSPVGSFVLVSFLVSRCAEGRRRAAGGPPAGRQRCRPPGRRARPGRSPAAASRRRPGRSAGSAPSRPGRRPGRTRRRPDRPDRPAPPWEAWATVASSSGPIAVINAAAPTPMAAPRTPPSAPWASDSPATWRTTLRCGQPIAFSVPSSRVRLVTEDSVSRLAIRKAASSATIVSAVPSLPARSLASWSEPPTRSARSCASVTSDDAKVCSILLETAPTSSCWWHGRRAC